MTKVNNTFFMLDYHPFFLSRLTMVVMFGRKHAMPSRCLTVSTEQQRQMIQSLAPSIPYVAHARTCY
jgi:hypothetical protein